MYGLHKIMRINSDYFPEYTVLTNWCLWWRRILFPLKRELHFKMLFIWASCFKGVILDRGWGNATMLSMGPYVLSHEACGLAPIGKCVLHDVHNGHLRDLVFVIKAKTALICVALLRDYGGLPQYCQQKDIKVNWKNCLLYMVQRICIAVAAGDELQRVWSV
jgi:hypothetical protein